MTDDKKKPISKKLTKVANTKSKQASRLNDVAKDDNLNIEKRVATNFSESIYYAITDTFANKNPTQLFSLCWPGTILDHEHLSWKESEELAGNMPERALIRTSQILDQYIPPAPITQPDGTRVSDRYKQALAQLGPMPNVDLIKLQEIIRKRLQKEITVTVNGEEKNMTIAQYFDYLNRQWTRAKQDWGKLQNQMRQQFTKEYPLNPEKAWDLYLAWYATNAEGHILTINAAYDQMLVEFPMVEWADAIAILDSSDDGGLNKAKELIRNATLPVPYQEGMDYTPTRGVPYSWPKQLVPSTKYIDLLSDPEAQQQAIDNARAQIEQEIRTWMSILPQIDDDQVKAEADAFRDAGIDYSAAQTALLETYTENAVTAVKVFADIMKSRGGNLATTPQAEQEGVVKEVNGLLSGLDKSSPSKGTGNPVDWDQVKKIAEQVGDGQGKLIKAQQELIDSGRRLASAATKFLQSEAQKIEFAWLEPYVLQLNSKLEALKKKEALLASASNVYYDYLNSPENKDNEDPNNSNAFGVNAFPSKLDYPETATWTKITTSIKQDILATSKTMNTNFERMQWGVNLFIASAGGDSEVSGTEFASKFMEQGDEIQIGFLAQKVLIDRSWMKPEVFQHTGSFFRTLEKKLAPLKQTVNDDVMGEANEEKLLSLLDNNSFPAYPVAVLLAKDIVIKVKIKASESEALRSTEKSVKSQGGGFLLFSVSSTQATSSEEESFNSYVMNGQMIARAPAPQIIGYWNQFLPPDNTTYIDEKVAQDIANALSFGKKLQAAHAEGHVSTNPPTKP